MPLYDWQREAFDLATDNEPRQVMVIAPTGAGKTRLLDRIEGTVDAERATFRGSGLDDVRAVYERIEEGGTVLLDEGGMLPDPFGLIHLIRGRPDVTTVIVTLPDVPSMAMIESEFEIVKVDD